MESGPQKKYNLFVRLLSMAKPYKRYYYISFLCIIILSFLGPLRPYLIGEMVDNYIINTQNKQKLLEWSLIIAGILMMEGVFQLTATYFSNLLAQSVIKDIRTKTFNHLLSFKMRYFDKTPVGALVTRVVSDVEAITEVFSAGLMEISGDLISLFFILILMFSTNWQLSLMTLIPLPVLIIATRIFAKAMKSSFQLERQQVTKLNTFVQEHITGMSIVQLFSRQKIEYAKFKEINKGHRQAHINAVWANSIFFPVVELLSSLSIAFLLVWGALKAGGKTSLEIKSMYGQIIAFTLWINQLYRPIRQLADKFNILQRGTVRAERIFEILDQEEHVQEDGTVTACDFNQDIQIKQLSFAYTKGQEVLKNINLVLEKGKTIALVGATGSGKTTIINLLSRFYDYEKGSILIGETELKSIQLKYLRANIAVVLQDVFLFSDSIHNNITLGNQEITREQVVSAAKAVGAHDFISQLPRGYDYAIGERGGELSVGQRQLLAFIRAFLYNPIVLILDEATSNLDNESEEMIQKATEKLTLNRTSVIIAHRLSTIQKADKIVVLEKGEIVEQGSHQQLLKKAGHYKNLFDKQFLEDNR
ncbi:MAG: ABC transporter ATP-binding protein [Flavobacteriia bacterium]|nr:ABC transporter ATP-binding protein [Flavobacteriia bacterium]